MQRSIIFCLLLLLMISSNAEAKWWIFGQSQDEVATRYIYLNDIGYDELDAEVTLYRDMLPAGRVVVKGRAQSGKNRIGAAEISLDGGKEWQKASLARDGSFEWSFVPEMNQEYDLALRLLDTAGKSNDIEETRKKLTVSDRDVQGLVREALDAMITAYQFENAQDFMKYVDPDFAGDSVILESAILKDFTILDQIEMRYTLNSLISGSGGKIFTSITFNRQVVVSRTGEVLKDKGQTEFTFNLTGDKARVFSMKNPLIFGLSEKEDVATGDVNAADNANTLQIPADGGLPFVGSPEDSELAGNVPTPTNMRVTDSAPHHMYSFAFDFPINSAEVDLSTTYWIILEEALSSNGPWMEVFREEFWDPRFGNITTDNIASTGAFLYYRAKVESQANGEQSLPSNVVMVDNR